VALFNAIQATGVFEVFGSKRQRKRYLYSGDGQKYWAMTTDISDCTVLNRMKIEDDLERLRLEGQKVAVAYGLAKLDHGKAWIDRQTDEQVDAQTGEITPAPEVPPA